MRRFLYAVVVLTAFVLLLYAVRVPLLKSLGSFLTKSDEPRHVPVIFVLSGAAYDRGLKAAELYRQGFAPLVVCTGGNVDPNMLALGREFFECELTQAMLLNHGVDSAAVLLLPEGTSTYEESEAIERYCLDRNIASCIVVTSLFHTRRVSRTVEKRLETAGIETYVVGAPPRHYDPAAWWKSEYGLIDLNNEYVKLGYYILKY